MAFNIFRRPEKSLDDENSSGIGNSETNSFSETLNGLNPDQLRNKLAEVTKERDDMLAMGEGKNQPDNLKKLDMLNGKRSVIFDRLKNK